jgi:hypothetical protein
MLRGRRVVVVVVVVLVGGCIDYYYFQRGGFQVKALVHARRRYFDLLEPAQQPALRMAVSLQVELLCISQGVSARVGRRTNTRGRRSNCS